MLPESFASKHYKSAQKRFMKPAIENFLKTEFPKMFGPNVCGYIADRLVELLDQNNRDIKNLKSGQLLWNAIHKDTRADSKNLKLVPVVLTLISEQDIRDLANGLKIHQHKENVVARMLKEAYEQNALLSMRDIGLILAMDNSSASCIRKRYEEKHKTTLPHPGVLQDMGSCLTHKSQIIYKCVVEKKSPLKAAKETNHTIKAVDNYLKDFNRVKTLYLDDKDTDYIHLVTKMSVNLINQYINIINQYVKEPKTAI